MKDFFSIFSFIIFFVFLSSPALATETYECLYSHYSNKEGLHDAEKNFLLTFVIDKEANKSYIVGNNGSNEVKYIDGYGVSFVEITQVGNIMTTAIDSEMNSVHSRHSILSGKLIPSQYYGQCVKR
ncbi:MAG: hypothetical protein OEY94_01315 [Alphaproteobacteria bacterium]|nr:hypothetical protein [Alphaproteobacteria bacterium]